MKLIDGKRIGDEILKDVRITMASNNYPVPPLLHIFTPTADPAAVMYANLKKKTAERIGVRCQVVHLGEETNADKLIDLLQKVSSNETRKFPYGVMVQLPMYPHLQRMQAEILNSIPAAHDVDGLTASNLGKVIQGDKSGIQPATVKAVVLAIGKTLSQASFKREPDKCLAGKQVVIVNNSALIGKPLSAVLSNMGATVTICSKYTLDLASMTTQADILITGTGTPGLIKHSMIKPGSTLIDITSIGQGDKIVGDIEMSPELEQKAEWLTPVPGGIGPLTIASLFSNLVQLPL